MLATLSPISAELISLLQSGLHIHAIAERIAGDPALSDAWDHYILTASAREHVALVALTHECQGDPALRRPIGGAGAGDHNQTVECGIVRFGRKYKVRVWVPRPEGYYQYVGLFANLADARKAYRAAKRRLMRADEVQGRGRRRRT